LLQINPEHAAAYNNRAWIYFKMGQAEKGLPDVQKALQLVV
jgi:hypothetical protein